MNVKTLTRFYNDKPIRVCVDTDNDVWYYSAVDLVKAFVKTNNPRRYWSDLKSRNKKIFKKCVQLKLTAKDNKKYNTDLLSEPQLRALLARFSIDDSQSIINMLSGSDNQTYDDSKQKAYKLFNSQFLKDNEVGTTKGLQEIHAYLYDGLYENAGTIRTETIANDDFIYCDASRLEQTLENIDSMEETELQDIVNKYIGMNIAHPFMKGNGISMRIWLDQILKKNLKKCVDWSKIKKEDYVRAMKQSLYNSKIIYELIKKALTTKINDEEVFTRSIDYSFYYEELEQTRIYDNQNEEND